MKPNRLVLLLPLFLLSLQSFGQVAVHDAILESISTRKYAQPGDRLSIAGVIRNNGTEVLTRLTISWQAGDGEVHSYVKQDMSVVKSVRTSFTHPTLLTVSGTDDIHITIWISGPNGAADEKPRSDTLRHVIQVVESFPPKNFLIEQVTGTWCGYCPRAPIIYKKVVEPVYPNSILVAIHTGDPMEILEASQVMSAYVSGVPCGFVNRAAPAGYTVDMAPEQWKGAMDVMDPDFTPAELNLYNYFDLETGEWKIDLVVDFIIDFEGDLRVNCYVLEDSLSGTGAEWQQRNFFNGGASDPYRELQGAGDPLPGYKYNHVVRRMIGGSWGRSGIIPSSVKRGDRYIWSTTIQASSLWRVRNLSLVGLLQVYSSNSGYRPILNATHAPLAYKTGIAETRLPLTVKIYPNPARDLVHIETGGEAGKQVEVVLYDVNGKILWRESAGAGSESRRSFVIETAAFPRGVYFVKLIHGSDQTVKKLIINP